MRELNTDSRERQENGSSAVPSSNSIDEMYRSSFTQRLRDSIAKAKGGETNPRLEVVKHILLHRGNHETF